MDDPRIAIRSVLLDEIERICKADPALYPDIETFVNDACTERIAQARKTVKVLA